MTDDHMMTTQRFCALAEAYGGDVNRWPAAEQPAARALLAEEASLTAVLSEAGAVDELLAASPDPLFSGVLREKLLAGAPKPIRRVASAARWLSGAGLAAACAAGILIGATYSDHIIGDPNDSVVAEASTSFDSGADILGLGETG